MTPRSRHSAAMALVLTLLIVAALSMVVVAFLSSMRLERMASNGYLSKAHADLMAEAAHADALQRLKRITTEGPFAAVFAMDSQTPYLFLAKRPPDRPPAQPLHIPLFSTRLNTDHASFPPPSPIPSDPFAIETTSRDGKPVSLLLAKPRDISTDINLARTKDGLPFTGLRSGNAHLPIHVNWIYQKNSSGRVVGRYAFWVDDECSKLDLRFAGNVDGNNESHLHNDGTSRNEISLTPLLNLKVSYPQLQRLHDFSSSFPAYPDLTALRMEYGTGKPLDDDAWQSASPYLTMHSLHDTRAPDGKRRLDLNALVQSTTDSAEIALQVEAITNAIRDCLPEFGLRAHHLKSGAPDTPDDITQSQYLLALAANIRDFIDPDHARTTLTREGLPLHVDSGNFVPYDLVDSEIPVFGMEQGPFLSEYLRVARVTSPHFASGEQEVSIRFAHYFELHNPTGSTLTFDDLGPNPRILLCNREPWRQSVATAAPGLRPPDIVARLPEDFLIKAGGYSVLTTDGPPFHDSQLSHHGPPERYTLTQGAEPGNWQAVDPGGCDMPNTNSPYEDYVTTTTATTNNRYGLKASSALSTPYADNRERLLLLNDNGVIDCSLRIYMNGQQNLGRNSRNPVYALTFPADPHTHSRNTPNADNAEPRFSRGDPRANANIHSLGNHAGSCWKDGGRRSGGLPYQATLGTENFHSNQSDIPHGELWRKGWREFTEDPAGNHFIANRPLRSVAELGAVADPARCDSAGFRSLGGTLRIGQSDSPLNNRAGNSQNPDATAWLGGCGGLSPDEASYASQAFQLADVFRVDDFEAGKLNPNGLARDPNAMVVIQALCDGFLFHSAPHPQASTILAGRSVRSDDLAAVAADWMKSHGGWFNDTELGELPIFHGTPSSNSLPHSAKLADGADITMASDAGKEEFLRRTAGLLATQSLAFTIHAVGQSGRLNDDSPITTFQITGRSSIKTTIQIRPHWPIPHSPAIRPTPESWEIWVVRQFHQ